MLSKPEPCNACRYHLISSGFCKDRGNPATAKIAMMLSHPSDKDLTVGEMWPGGSAKAHVEYLLKPAGLELRDVLVCAGIRCRGPKIPTDVVLENAMKHCRVYDDGLRAFAPTLAICTYSLSDIRKVPALSRLVIADLRKAVRMHERGFRPVMLMGEAPTKLVFPYVTGLRHWRGNWQEMEGWGY